jgi:hypothetical protein
MPLILDAPVGLRNKTTKVTSKLSDQRTIIQLLAKIKSTDGGKTGLAPGSKDGECSKALAEAIWNFQVHWSRRGVLKMVDGVVEPERSTWKKLVQLAEGPPPPPPGTISLTQTNPPSWVAAQERITPVISPLALGSKLNEIVVKPKLHNLLFRLQKNADTFWVGAAVPEGTTDFSQVQVFFHPTVVNGKSVHAKDSDYAAFQGGWSESLQRYVGMEGAQVAAARRVPMIVPFTTMTALATGPNMFATRPVETLNEIMNAIRAEIIPGSGPAPPLRSIGVASFSSGITARGKFITALASSGLIKELIDLDSPHIIGSSKNLVHVPGAVSRCFTQFVKPMPELGWFQFETTRFSEIHTFRDKGPHAQIGWMMYFMAMLSSPIV